MSSQRITVHPKEAAALDRLLDAYIATDEHDPGRDALIAFKKRIERVEHDHSDYEAMFDDIGPDWRGDYTAPEGHDDSPDQGVHRFDGGGSW